MHFNNKELSMTKSKSVIWVSPVYANISLVKRLRAYSDMDLLTPGAKHFQELIYFNLRGGYDSRR